ncbi:polysaccharide lyase 8 family protein [Streptococcus merionis]|uniref:polysaccharide lyase 8 family protein n=1 Tax=Streptococcus merionis TaxID=400065 RepID=UPI003516D360
MRKNIKYDYLLLSTVVLGMFALSMPHAVEAEELEGETMQNVSLEEHATSSISLPDKGSGAIATESSQLGQSSVLSQVSTEQSLYEDRKDNINIPSEVKPTEESIDTANQVKENSSVEISLQDDSQENLLVNGNFEETAPRSGQWSGPSATGWTVWTDKSKTDSKATPTIQVNDQGQLLIESEKTYRGVVHQTIPIKEKAYDISFDIKTTDKVGQAYVRILGFNGKKQEEVWRSDMTMGSKGWSRLEKQYVPKSTVNSAKIELFFETGTGKVLFDNIIFKPIKEEESSPKPPIEDEKNKSSLKIALNKKYVFEGEYHYKITDSTIAQISQGILIGKKEGITQVEAFDSNNQLIRKFDVEIRPSENDHYTNLVSSWVKTIVGNEYFNPQNPYMAQFNQSLEKKVEEYISNLNKEADKKGLWTDISDFSNASSHITSHYRRLEDISKVVTNPYSKYYEDAELIKLVKSGMAWLYQNVYNEAKQIDGKANWWDYEIGAPRAINNTLSIMHAYFSEEEIQKYTNPIEKFVPNSTHFRSTLANPFEAIGGNLVDMGRVKLIAGILRKNDREIKETVDSISKLFHLVTKGEGFYQDGSYIAHTNVAYTGAYGNVLIDGLSQILPLIQQTEFKLPKENLDVINHWLQKAFIPLIIKGELMDMSRGRSISRSNSESHVAAVEVLRGINILSEMYDNPLKQDLKMVVKSIVKEDTFHSVYDSLKTYQDFVLMDKLLNDQSVPTRNLKSYVSDFNHMDKLAMYHAGKDFGFALSMHSKRTLNYEAMNSENVRGWYTGDGMFYLYNGDLGHYSNHYWATVNPYKMPGTTENDANRSDATKEVVKNNFPLTGQVTLPSEFVGSLKFDDINALATMDFTNWDKTLTLKKSWSIIDGKIVFLGSDIQNRSANKISTTIDQRKETEPYRVFINGQEKPATKDSVSHQGVTKIFLEGADLKKNIGYIFFKPTTLTVSRKLQEGSWNDINRSQSSQNEKNTFLTLEQEHSNSGDSYAYIMLPNIDREAFDQLEKEMPLKLLANDKDLQAIYDSTQDMWSVVKYGTSKTVFKGGFELEKPGLYILKKQGEKYSLKYYDPISMEHTESELVAPDDKSKDSHVKKPEKSDSSKIVKPQQNAMSTDTSNDKATLGDADRNSTLKVTVKKAWNDAISRLFQGTDFDLYEISFWDENSNVTQSTEPAIITLPTNGGKEVVGVYDITPSGQYQELTFTILETGQMVQFMASHSGYYAIIYRDNASKTSANSNHLKAHSQYSGYYLPKTADSSRNLSYRIYGFLLLAFSLLLSIFKKSFSKDLRK